MEVFAHVKYVRMSPRKVKLVADMIRGKDVKTATAFLKQTSKAACEPMLCCWLLLWFCPWLPAAPRKKPPLPMLKLPLKSSWVCAAL